MEVRIGITQSPREIVFESDKTAAELEALLAKQFAEDDEGLVRLTDQKGHVYLIPAKSLAFVELASEAVRKVGFAP